MLEDGALVLIKVGRLEGLVGTVLETHYSREKVRVAVTDYYGIPYRLLYKVWDLEVVE